jgi:PadR family transcriptional regulator PadR
MACSTASRRMPVSGGTIYPLLSRLRRDHHVSTFWQESESGPPRRYYQLTEAGERALAEFTDEGTRFRNAVVALLTTTRRSTVNGHAEVILCGITLVAGSGGTPVPVSTP